MKRKLIMLILAAMLAAALAPATASALTFKEIGGEFICQCGCKQNLSECSNSMTCNTSANLKEVIDKMIDDGSDRGQIIQAMRTNYSDLILSAPPKEGFNLMAYVTPFILVIAGSIGLTVVLSGWVRKNRQAGGAPTEGPDGKEDSPVDEKYSSRLKDELDDLRW